MAKKIAVRYIREIAEELGLDYWIEPEFGYIGYITIEGRKYYFRNTSIDINNAGTMKIATDKGYTAIILEKFGFRVPTGKTFLSDRFSLVAGLDIGKERAIEYAKEIGLPVYIKPNNLAEGSGVFRVDNPEDISQTIDDVIEFSERYRVEKYFPGSDYRVLVLGDEVLATYERRHLGIVGDGKHSIEELLAEKIEQERNNGRNLPLKLEDIRIKKTLSRKDKNLQSVLDEEEILTLLDNANLSSGGEMLDLSTKIHDDYKDIAIRATRELGLTLCGVDILTDDITKSLEENRGRYIILEMNGSPGLSHYATESEEASQRVKNIYRKVIELLRSRT